MKNWIAIFTICILLLTMAGCQLKREESCIAYVSEDLTEAEARELGVLINEIDGIVNVTFVSAEEALEEFEAQHADEEAFSNIDASYLRHRYEITVKKGKLDTVVKELEKLEGIAKVQTAKEILGPLA